MSRAAHSRRRRALAIAALALAAVAALGLASPARAGTFRFSQCNAVEGGALAPRGYFASAWTYVGGWAAADCGHPGGNLTFATPDHRLPAHGHADSVLELPRSMPRTSLRTAWLDWRSMPQSGSTNPAYFVLYSAGTRLIEATSGTGTAPGRPQRIATPIGARSLRFTTWCSPVNGPGWCNWPRHHFELRGMTLELEESGAPAASASGVLLAGGAHSGVEPLSIGASDGDSGIGRIDVLLGGRPVGSLTPAGGCRDDRLPPCPPKLRGTVDVDTRSVADGRHRLRLVAVDAAGNRATADAGVVLVANDVVVTTPAPPPPGDASTPVSAPAGDGRDPFPPNPVAGRGRNGTNASERARVRAWLELDSRSGGAAGRRVRRRSVVVPPGVRVRIRGRVTDPRGRPIGRAILAAIRRQRGGPWRAVTGVRTRRNGRFTAFARIGPSQDLRFVYYATGASRHGARSPILRVRVRR